MAELAFAGNEYFEVSDIEVNSKEEISYSVDTLNLLNEKYKPENVKLYFLIGSDNLADLSRWKQPHKLFELSEVVVVVRPEYKYDDTPDEYRSKSVYIKAPLLEISSSEIRKKVAEGKSIRYYVHPEVEKYIYENNLYKKINN